MLDNTLDELDEKLITLLRHDGRLSISDLAKSVGVSRITVSTRLGRLERVGEIVGYTVVLRADTVDQTVRGIMMISIDGSGTDNVIRALGALPEVTVVHSTNGRWDLIAELGTKSLIDFDAILRRIRLIQGIAGSETNLLLATPRSTKAKL